MRKQDFEKLVESVRQAGRIRCGEAEASRVTEFAPVAVEPAVRRRGRRRVGGILGRYRAVLLDMNGTFMFGEDRFGPTEDYGATYHSLGGTVLDGGSVRGAVTACYGRMAAIYGDPSRTDSFPQVMETLRTLPQTAGWAEGNLALVEQVIAAHELGRVPDAYADGLRRLAATHRLGLVANVWSRKEPWLEELRRAGVLGAFDVCIFPRTGRA